MRLVRLGTHLLGDVTLDLWRHRGQNLMAVLAMASGLLLAGGGLLLVEGLDRWVARLEMQARITLWAEEGHGLEETEAALRRDPRFSDIRRIGSVENTRRFRELSRESGLMLESLGGEPLPESLEVQLRPDLAQANKAMEVAASLSRLPGVADVLADQERLQGFQRHARLARTALAVFGFLLLMAAGFSTGNVIRMNLTLREDEISIMRLVGATEAFIRTPLLLVGASLGLAGSALAVGGLWALWWPLTQGAGGISPFLVSLAKQGFFSYRSLLLLGVFGAGTGALGSWWGFWITQRTQREIAVTQAPD
jgi:cell division transport system permease protein